MSPPAFNIFKSGLAIFNWVFLLSKNLQPYFIHPRFTETCWFLSVIQTVSNASALCCTTPHPTLFMTKAEGNFWGGFCEPYLIKKITTK